MRLKYLLINLFILFFFSINLFATESLKKVSIQLEWKHQFEFAGFYAAKEEGYYKDIGIDLEIKEYHNGIDISGDVINSKSTFGVSSSSLILEKLQNKPVVLLASYLKQNALAFVVKKNIKKPSDLMGKKVMAVNWELEHTSLGVMLKDANIKSSDITLIQHDYKIDKFVNGEVDAMSVFITSQPFELDALGVDYNILNPANFGIYSYDMELFTSENFAKNNPELVQEFTDATNKGWEYAFKNKNEIVKLIHDKYSKRKTKKALIYEANKMEKLFKRHIFKMGAIVPELIKLNTQMYMKLGLVKEDLKVDTILLDYVIKKTKHKKLFLKEDMKILTKKEKNWLKNNPMVRVAVMNYWNHDGSGNTIHTDYLKLLNRYSDLNIVPVRYDAWKEGYGEVISDNSILHGIMNLAWNVEREEKYFTYSKSYIFEPSYLVVRENNTDIINLQDLEHKAVLSKDKSITDNIIKDISSNIKIVPVKSDEMMYDRINSDKNIDAFITYKKDDKLLKKHNLKVVKTIYDKYSAGSIGVKKQHPYLKSIINKIYNRIPKDELSNLQNKIYNDTKPYKAHQVLKNKINFTKEELLYLKNNSNIKVHNESDWAPYNYNIDGKPYGFSIDYMNLIASKTGLNVEYINGFTWNQFLQKIKNEEIDVMLNIVKTEKREQYLNFTNSYTKSIDAIFTNKNNKIFKTLKDLNGKKLAIIKGFYEENIIKKYYPDIKIVYVSNSLDGLKAVAFGNVDAMISSFGVGNYLINQYNLSNIKPAFEIADKKFSLDLGLATNKKDTILRDILNKGMDVITQNEILKLKKKWIGGSNKLNDKNILNLNNMQLKYLEKKKNIAMCIDPNWMPFEKIEDETHIGLSADYFKLFSEKLNIPITLVKTKTWSESLELAKNRKCDILSLAMETPSRKKYMNFTKPYLKVPLVIATKLDVSFITDINTLSTEKVGIAKGYAFGEILRKKYPNLNMVDVDNVTDGLKKVKNGELFAYIGTLASVGYVFQKEYTGELKIAGKLDDNWELGVAVRNDDKILLEIFQKVVDSIDKDTHKRIFNKWIAIRYEKGIDYTLVWQVVIISFLIITGAIYWNRRLSYLNHQLEESKLKAESLSIAKSNFLSNISHEIRTPMNAIIGMTYIVQKTNLDKNQKSYMDKINLASNSLLRLINDVLDFSKIEAGKLSIIKVDFNLKTILNDVENIVSIMLKDKDLDFKIKYDKNLPIHLYGDNLRVSQVLINLVSNAIKFTKEGKVELIIEQKEINRFKFTISDTGIGLSEDQIKNLFNSFTQGDDSITRKFGGTGLGLAISKQLVELMNGKIWAESELHIGSKFIFEVELSKSGSYVDVDENFNKNKTNQDIKIKKDIISKERLDKLFEELKIVVLKRRPNLCKPIIEELDMYNLNEDTELFEEIKKQFKKYKFNEIMEILNER